jgi:hypothetical protein
MEAIFTVEYGSSRNPSHLIILANCTTYRDTALDIKHMFHFSLQLFVETLSSPKDIY